MRLPLVELSCIAVLGIASCCNDVDETQCFEWPESTQCPSREDAAPKLGVQPDEVTSDGTFWPAHDYLVGKETIVEPAQCCYDATVSVCTTELH